MIRAFLFDLDDTLAATAPLWRDAEEHLLQTIGAEWSAALAARYKGMNAPDLATVVHGEIAPDLSLADCRQTMRNRLLANFRQGPIDAIDGAIELVKRCRDRKVKMAVASGSPEQAIERALRALGLSDCFDLTLSSEKVARGKPHPDVYLATAERLNVEPTDCLVFEDSRVGARAARTAGMTCIVRPSLPDADMANVASRVVNDWREVTESDLTAGK
ncbi:MAG: HAD family phosphatase [Phycisphaeraceae bacterium]|nr:HAD family phosphatase [Phycisphaeraceae bacterium]